ncbi:uncharacterized protein N7459_003577 [Penicillium hispanicum]|uniref:uncharacterized protein n=1 Tax=Penicillium hispanicum TaxID=1080232 RepID=UPI00253FC10F|nr:uncharacterized protein N7459_003577 [Penicillium hispanicum]KAJ5587812.1 hypothetical protein N7459_003577 [Penicillium hispanicum]
MRLAATFSLALLASASAAEEPSYLASTTANTSHATDSATISGAEDALRRNAEVASRLAVASARGVRKMSADEGEKFFLDYWQFGDDPQGGLSERDAGDVNSTSTSANEVPESSDLGSTVYEHSPAELFSPRSFPYHPSFDANTTNLEGGFKARWRSLLESRDFKCPTETLARAMLGVVRTARRAVGLSGPVRADTPRAQRLWAADVASQAMSVCPGAPFVLVNLDQQQHAKFGYSGTASPTHESLHRD